VTANAGGLEVDFGEFVTAAGAEVIETNANWNYSRSLLFAWAIPYYHFGLRGAVPVGSHFTGGVQVVNGWNNIADNYDHEIFNVFKNDKKRKLKKYIMKYANKKNTAIDFGCGVARRLPGARVFVEEGACIQKRLSG
jgi:hypothetical protein